LPDGAELILSKSSIDEWMRCHKAWMFGYAYRIKGAPNLDMFVGTLLHGMVEGYWRGTDPEKALVATWDREVQSMDPLASDEVSRCLADARGLFQTYLDKIVPTFPKPPTLIERDFLIRVNGTLVSGRLDCATEDPDEVRDTKTTSTPSKVTPERHQLGQTLYAWGFAAITGRMPARLLLDIVGKNGRVAVKEVEPDFAGAAEVVGMVAKGIREGDFAPTGAAKGSCWSCPYQAICPDANLGLTPVVESADILELVQVEGAL
jgi:hypothetical protein